MSQSAMGDSLTRCYLYEHTPHSVTPTATDILQHTTHMHNVTHY